MFLKLRPLLYSLIYLFGLELVVAMPGFVFPIFSFMFLFSLYAGKKLGHLWKYSVLPAFFTLSSVALLYLITLHYEQHIFILLSTSLYYLSLFGAYRLGQYEEDRTARGMNMAATAATIFFTYASFYGLYLNFLVPLYVLMVAYLAVTLLVSYQHFSIICVREKDGPGGDEKQKDWRLAWIYSFILSLIMAELIWTMNFWPFGYLTTGVIALMLYYVIWDIIQSYFLNLLSRRRVVANMLLFSVLICVILLSSKWIPVI